MIGGWRPWQRWMVARHLERHARREGGEPPPDLLRRLREDIPSRPALMRHPDRPLLAERERRGAAHRWLAAASLAAALTASVVGLRVWQEQLRDVSPGPAAAASQPLRAFPTLPRKAAPEAAAAPPAGLAGLSTGGGLPVAPADATRPGTAAGGAVRGEPRTPSATADEIAARSEAAAGDEAAQGWAWQRPKLERARRGNASQPQRRSAATPAAPSGMLAKEAAPEERAEGAAQPVAVPGAVSPPLPPAPTTAPRPAVGAEAKIATSRAAQELAPPKPAVPLRSSFGADTGTDFYRRVRRGLLAEGRLPRAASVRADELANAFDLAGEVQAVGRPELSAEGAPLPAAGATYLVRFEARGLLGRSSPDAVEVEFDPAVVARFHRVGSTAHRGGAAALYEIELRPDVAAAPLALEVMAESQPDAAETAAVPRPVAPPRMKAASPPTAGEPRGAPDSRAGKGAQDRVIATLRVVSRDQGSSQGGALLAARVVRLHQLHPSWDAASPALRVQGLAVQLAQALAARDPGPRLQEVRARARALAIELPEDPKAAELLQLADRAADLAGASGSAMPRPQ